MNTVANREEAAESLPGPLENAATTASNHNNNNNKNSEVPIHGAATAGITDKVTKQRRSGGIYAGATGRSHSKCCDR